jgi:hypothetical protein
MTRYPTWMPRNQVSYLKGSSMDTTLKNSVSFSVSDTTLNYSKLLHIDGSPDGIATSSGRMLLTDERPKALLGCSDKNKGFEFCWVGICTESSWNSEITFLKLVTLKHVILKPFPYQRNKLWISEDSEIYDIPVKAATLHDNDFVNRMQPIKN